MPNKPSELLAPAGSFSAGIYALRSGADAVYLGLKAFSARKSARNFSVDEVAKIKAYAEGEGKRVYVAFNTLLRDEEMEEAARFLHDLEALEIDGLIIQDLGLLKLLRSSFPNLPVHASTQMAAHNSEGVAFLKGEGVRRVILSRELSWVELARIRKDHPDIELEVFIHGALCYSFSGLCLASGLLLDRSGNRGECAQICRSWFDLEEDDEDAGAGRLPSRGYYFSCNDLRTGEEVLRLQELGIDSFKIEGRMKPPEWVSAVTSYYRAILIGGREEVKRKAEDKARTIFARNTTRGYGPVTGGERLLSADYPGHRGVPAGTVEAVRADGFLLLLETDLAFRDGLLFFQKTESGDIPWPFPFGAASLGERWTQVRAGSRAWIASRTIPEIGDRVYKISSHSAALPEVTENLPRKLLPLDLAVEIRPGELSLEFKSLAPGLPGLTFTQAVAAEKAKRNQSFREILADRFTAPGDSRFEVRKVSLANESGFSEDAIFVNPSTLKEIRRKAFALLEETYENTRLSRAAAAVAAGASPGSAARTEGLHEVPPARGLIRDPASGLPFQADAAKLRLEDLYRAEEGTLYLALAPVLFDAEAYLAAVKDFLLRSLRTDPTLRFRLGLGNVGHFALARALEKEERVEFFIDYGLYAANGMALGLFRERVPRLRFFYPWIENPVPPAPGLPSGRYGDFRPPLFVSRACVWRHAAEVGCEGCSAARSATLKQGKRRFRLSSVRVAGSCQNFLFEGV